MHILNTEAQALPRSTSELRSNSHVWNTIGKLFHPVTPITPSSLLYLGTLTTVCLACVCRRESSTLSINLHKLSDSQISIGTTAAMAVTSAPSYKNGLTPARLRELLDAGLFFRNLYGLAHLRKLSVTEQEFSLFIAAAVSTGVANLSACIDLAADDSDD